MDPARKTTPPTDPRPLRWWWPVGLALLIGHAVYALWRVNAGHSDFLCFHHTSRHWLATGEFTQAYGVRHYLPAFTVLITPLVAWPLRAAILLWALLNGVLLALSVREASRQAGREVNAALPPVLFWVWPMVLVLPFASGTLTLGQVNILALWLCLWSYAQAQKRKDLIAGWAIGLASIVKLYPLLLIVPLALRGRYRAAGWALFSFVLLAGGLSLAGFGWRGSIEAHRQWLAEARGGDASEGHLIFRDGPSEFLRHNNQSLAAVVRRLTTRVDTGRERKTPPVALTLGQAKGLYAALAGGLFVWLAFQTWKRRGQELSLAEWSAWLTAVIAFVPIYWTHYFVLLLPALALTGARVWQGHGGRTGTAIQAAWLIGMLLLAVEPARWLGMHCWLALAMGIWCLLAQEANVPGRAE